MPTKESEMFLAQKPKVAPTFDGVDMLDNAAVFAARDAIVREQAVQAAMMKLVGDELGKCYNREGVNHLANCGKFRERYLQLLHNSRGNAGYIGQQHAYQSKKTGPDGTEVADIQEYYPTRQEALGTQIDDNDFSKTKGYGPGGEGGKIPEEKNSGKRWW